MIEVLEKLRQLESSAASLDKTVIAGRVERVRRNISQIEGVNRSDNHVRRLAGISADVYRKPRSVAAVQWVAATAFETQEQSLRVRAFWESVFDVMADHEARVAGDFWMLEEEISRLMCELRKSHLDRDYNAERLCLMKIRRDVDAMLHLAVVVGREE